MVESNIKIFAVLSSFTETGMDIFSEYPIPNLTSSELKIIANYYSIIFSKDQQNEGLYGPLPIAYHTDLLLFVYTFQMRNKLHKDPRIIDNDYLAPTSLLLFYPTPIENIVNQSRDKIASGIKAWKAKYKDIHEITKNHLSALNTSLCYTIDKESKKQEMSETEKINIVLSKSVELLYNINNYQNSTSNLLIVGTIPLVFQFARLTFLEKNSNIVDFFSYENDVMKIKLGKINLKIALLDIEKPNIQKYLNNDLSGIMYFANFSTEKAAEAHSQQLEEIIKYTNQNCLISYAIAQKNEPTLIEQTNLPLYLSKAKGRTIVLFDLASENMNIGKALLETLDVLVEITARVKMS